MGGAGNVSKSIIRLLIADDSADEAESMSNALRQAGYMLKTQRIEDITTLTAALSKDAWDACVCKSGLPRLKINDAQQIIDKHQPACALFLVVKKITVDEIRRATTAGVRDVFIQGDWTRLGPAIEREIETGKARHAHIETTKTLRQLENRYRVMIENSQEAVAYCHDGVYVDANPAYLNLVGCATVDDLHTIPVLNLIDKNDHTRFKNWLRKPNSHEGMQEFLALASDGRSFAAEIAMSPLQLGGESCVQIFVRDVSKRKLLETKLQYLHQRDALTGIYNRTYFLQALARVVELAEKDKTETQLVGVEILGLKRINQDLGHTAGDRILMSITRQLREHAGEDQLLARTGGGQFSLLLAGKSENEIKKFIADVRKSIATLRIKDDGNDTAIDISVIHVAIDGSITDREKLLNLISIPTEQIATSVRLNKETVVESTPAIETQQPKNSLTHETNTLPGVNTAELRDQPDLSGRISAALQNNSMQLLFQPIVNLHGEPREMFEVLPIIQTDTGEVLGTDAFMAAAINSGQAGKIDRWIMQQCIDHLAKRQKTGQETSLFVSLSGSVLADKMLLQAVRQHIKTARLDAGRLHIQLSAALVKEQNVVARAFIEEARQIGINIVIDGLDSRHIKVEELSGIDIAYIAIDCHSNPASGESLVSDETLRNTVALARKLKATTIARRVENADVFSLLWGAAVDYIQGDYLSPALTSPDHNFTEEQTLSSDIAQPAFNMKAAG